MRISRTIKTDSVVDLGIGTKSRLFEIISTNSPPESTYRITLPRGTDTLEFRAYKSLAELEQIHGQAAIWSVTVSESVKPGGPLAKYAALGEVDFRAAFILGHLSTEFEAGDFLEIASRNPILFRYIIRAVDHASYGDDLVIAQEGLDAAKKESGTPLSTETG